LYLMSESRSYKSIEIKIKSRSYNQVNQDLIKILIRFLPGVNM